MELRRGRRGVASVVGTILFVIVLMLAIGAEVYIQGLQTQSDQIAQAAQRVADRRSTEALVYSGSGASALSVTNFGLSSSTVNAIFLRYPNGTIFRVPLSSPAQLPLSTNTLLELLVPSQTCGSTTCLADFSAIANNLAPSGSLIGVGTGYGNTFWYGPSEALVNWSNITNLPSSCSLNQYVTGLGTSSLVCSQVGWNQLTGFPSPCASNQYVSAYGATLSCGNIILPWSQLSNFPSACPARNYVVQITTTLSCQPAFGSVRLTSDAATSTIRSTGLVVALAASNAYAFTAYTWVTCVTCVETFNFQIHALPSGANLVVACAGASSMSGGSLGGYGGCVGTTGTDIASGFPFGASGQQWLVIVNGVVVLGSAAGNLQIDVHCSQSCGTVTVKTGSFMVVYPVA